MKPFYRYILPIAGATVIMFLLASVASLTGIRHEAEEHARHEVEYRLGTFWELLKNKGETFRIVNGRMLAGNYVINGNHELPDRVCRIFGGRATIFMGDVRVSTNVLNADGSRAVGTRLSEVVRDTVLVRGIPYRGNAEFLGKEYFAAYDPIRDQSGTIIGAIYAGSDKNAYMAQFDELRNKIIAIITSVLVLSLALLVIYVKHGWEIRRELIQHQRRLASIINGLPDATWAIDTNGVVIAWNRAIEELTGTKAVDIIGKGNFEYALPFYGERRPLLLDTTIRPMPEVERKYVSFSRRDGTVSAEVFIPHFRPGGFFAWATAACLLDASGNLVGAIETVRDITDHKRFQDVMLQTEKMLMAGGLAAGMAHEINNPLGVILQNIQNIQRRLTPGLAANERVAAETGMEFSHMQLYLKQRGVLELLDMVAAAGSKAADIVAQVTSFSQKSAARLEPAKLDQLVNRALELAACDYDIKKQYDFHTIRITRDFDGDIPAIMINSSEIEQAMINLLKNAIQAMKPATGEYTPEISLRTFLKGGYAAMEIADNGCGMTEETRQRIFEPFYTTKEVGIGTGLGLAVTHALVVKNHSGRIDVDSTPGQGTRFTVYLPLSAGGQA